MGDELEVLRDILDGIHGLRDLLRHQETPQVKVILSAQETPQLSTRPDLPCPGCTLGRGTLVFTPPELCVSCGGTGSVKDDDEEDVLADLLGGVQLEVRATKVVRHIIIPKDLYDQFPDKLEVRVIPIKGSE